MAKLIFVPGLGVYRTGGASENVFLPNAGVYTNRAEAGPPPDDAEVGLPTGSLVVNAHAPQVETTETPQVSRTPLLNIPTNPRVQLAVNTSDPLRPSHTLYLYNYSDFPVPSLESPSVTWEGGYPGSGNPAIWVADPRGEGPELFFQNDIARYSQILGLSSPTRPWTALCIHFEPTAGLGGTDKGVWTVGRDTPTHDYVSIHGDGRTPDAYLAYGEQESTGVTRDYWDLTKELAHDNTKYQISALSHTSGTQLEAYAAHNGDAAFTSLGNFFDFVGGPITDFPLDGIYPGLARVGSGSPRWFDSYIIAFLIWDNKALTTAELNELLNDANGFFRHVILSDNDQKSNLPTGHLQINAFDPQIETQSNVPVRTPLLGIPTNPREDLQIDLFDQLRPNYTFYMEGGPTAFPLPSFENESVQIIGGAGADLDAPVWVTDPNGEGDEMFFQQGPPNRSAYINLTPAPTRAWSIMVITRWPTGLTFASERAMFGVGQGGDHVSVQKHPTSHEYLPFGEQASQGDGDDYWYLTGGPVHDDTKYFFHVISAQDGTNVRAYIAPHDAASFTDLGEMSASVNFTAPIVDFPLSQMWLGGDSLTRTQPGNRFANGYIVAVNFWDSKALTLAEADELLTDGFFRHFQIATQVERTPKLKIPTASRENLKVLLLPDRPDYTFYFEGGPALLPVGSFEDPTVTIEEGAGAILTGPDWETGGPEGPELHFNPATPQAAHIAIPLPPGGNVNLTGAALQCNAYNPTTEAGVTPGPSECPGIIAPGYAAYPGSVRPDENWAQSFRYAVGLPYVSIMKIRARWKDVEGPLINDFSGLEQMLDSAVPFAEQNGWKISFELECQRFGSLDLSQDARTPKYMEDTGTYPGDSRGGQWERFGGMYFASTTTTNGKWLERLWDTNQHPYIDRKAIVTAKAYDYLKNGFSSDKSHLLAYVCATSETAKQDHGTQEGFGDGYTHAKFVAGHQYMATAFRRELDAVGATNIPIIFLLNYWPNNWANGDWEGKVIDPILASASGVGFGMRDSPVTVVTGGCTSRDIETDAKAELFDHCMRNHSTVPWMMTAENGSYTQCNSYTQNNQTLEELARTFNGDYSSHSGYQAQAGFWPKASMGRNGVHPHWFETYIARSEAEQQMIDSAGSFPLNQQANCKRYYP